MRASNIVKQAKSWLGKNENDGTFKEIIDVYNSHKPLARGYKVKYTDSWCATFVSAVAIKCGATDVIPTECSCQKMIELFKKLGCFIENEDRVPNVGDVIFYDWGDNGKGDNTGWSDHVGIVTEVNGKEFVVIEGNNDNAVKYRSMKANAKYIRGYGIPKYEVEVEAESVKSVEKVAKEVIDGKWDNGSVRRAMLESAGYDYSEVRAKVNELLGNKTTVKSESESKRTYKDGDVITLKEGATYWNGRAIPSWVFKKTIYYRGTNKNGIVFSILKTGAVTGTVKPEYVN